MPTFTTVALENLFHHGVRDSPKKPLREGREDADERIEGTRHLYIMPTLYSTPDQAPLPENAAPHSPSPYVVNHKRRGGGNEGTAVLELPKETDGVSLEDKEAEECEDNFLVEDFAYNDGASEEDEGFFDRGALELLPEAICEAVNERVSTGNEEATDLSRNEIDTRSYISAPGEFFDAIDEFTSDGSASSITSCDNRIESELNVSRLSLLEEIERRMTAEETLALMCCQWERIRKLMAEEGLTIPAVPVGSNIRLEDDLVDQIFQEIHVARFVAEAVGRGQARAEAEEAAAAIIDLKDQEILRLRDRLQYFETVNHELSQRNLVEVARRQQERKRSRKRWLWGFMGLSIAVGASVAAYIYIPQASETLFPNSSADGSADI